MLNVNWLEWVKALFDLAKGIAWPLAALIIVWIFKEEIRPRLAKITKASFTGVEFEGQPVESQKLDQTITVKPHPMPSVNQLAQSIMLELAPYKEEEKIPALIQNLASARVEAIFEFIFGNIFQSQIDALRALSKTPISLEDGRRLYESRVIPLNPEIYPNFPFDNWLRFLEMNHLIKVEDDVAKITDLGRDFLNFIDTKKIGMVRPK